jgi:DNA (cytosine-5)-methyltransferase 1
MKPKLLDLFCGVGGAAMGYHLAEFEVVGVDIKPQPHYPFEFHQADALTYPLEGFDAYHASPPCQAYSKAFSQLIGHRKEHPDLVARTRDYLTLSGKPFVIENVVGAPMTNFIQLDGTMFGLNVKKVRNFELHGFEIVLLPAHLLNTRGMIKSGHLVGLVQHSCYPNEKVKKEHLAVAYGMNWGCTRYELIQAIPPAYTEYIGKYLMQTVREVLSR